MSKRIGTFTIAQGARESNVLNIENSDITSLSLFTNALAETVKLYASPTGSTGWRPVKSDGEDVVLPANSCITLTKAPWLAIKLVAGGNAAEARKISVTGGN